MRVQPRMRARPAHRNAPAPRQIQVSPALEPCANSGAPGLGGPADVLDDPQVAGGVVLDALVAAAAERAGDVLDRWPPGRPRRPGRRAGSPRRPRRTPPRPPPPRRRPSMRVLAGS